MPPDEPPQDDSLQNLMDQERSASQGDVNASSMGAGPSFWDKMKPYLPWAIGAIVAAIIGYIIYRQMTSQGSTSTASSTTATATPSSTATTASTGTSQTAGNAPLTSAIQQEFSALNKSQQKDFQALAQQNQATAAAQQSQFQALAKQNQASAAAQQGQFQALAKQNQATAAAQQSQTQQIVTSQDHALQQLSASLQSALAQRAGNPQPAVTTQGAIPGAGQTTSYRTVTDVLGQATSVPKPTVVPASIQTAVTQAEQTMPSAVDTNPINNKKVVMPLSSSVPYNPSVIESYQQAEYKTPVPSGYPYQSYAASQLAVDKYVKANPGKPLPANLETLKAMGY